MRKHGYVTKAGHHELVWFLSQPQVAFVLGDRGGADSLVAGGVRWFDRPQVAS